VELDLPLPFAPPPRHAEPVFPFPAIDNDFQRFAKAMARHESFSGGHYYNQFNEGAGLHEQPFLGDNGRGWGIAQIDMDGNEPTSVVWDWKANIRKMNEMLRTKQHTCQELIRYYRETYGNRPDWTEPPASYVIDQIDLSALEWATMVRYNGWGGIEGQDFGTHTGVHSPWEFVIERDNQGQDHGRWQFHDNRNGYAHCIAAVLQAFLENQHEE